jgi:hypothetical protein
MFDVHCKYCGEPWDNDFFHDCVKDEHFDSYQKAVKAFTSFGCGFRDGKKCTAPTVDDGAAWYAQVSQDLSDCPDDWIM